MGQWKIEELIAEKDLAKALGVSRALLANFRSEGLPFIKIGIRTFYFEPHFMDWIMKNKKRRTDPEHSCKETTQETKKDEVNKETIEG